MACSRNQDLYCGKILLYFQENRTNIRNKKRSYRWQTARRICANALAWRWPKHARLSQYVLSCRIWSFCVKWCTHKYRRTPKLGRPGTPLFWGGKRGWPQDTRLSPILCYHFQLVSSAIKGVRINRKKLQKLGERWDPDDLRWTAWLTTYEQATSLYVLPRQIW